MAVIVLHYGTRSRMIALPDSWDDLIDEISDFLDVFCEEADLTIFMTPPWASKEVELDPSAFEAVKHKSELRVVVNGDDGSCDGCLPALSEATTVEEVHAARPTRAAAETNTGRTIYTPSHTSDGESVSMFAAPSKVNLTVKTLNGKLFAVRIQLDATVEDVKRAIYNKEGIPKELQRLIFGGNVLEDKQTLKSYGVTSDSVVHFVSTLRGAKPAIFILSPCSIPQVEVTISLSEQWRLTDLFPPTKDDTIKSHVGSTHWRVMADKHGILLDHATGIRTPYLFWEAETVAFPRLGNPFLSGFNPLAPELVPPKASMMPMNRLIPYLSDQLGTLFMDATMRADFITYWIRDFRHLETQDMDIAFTFVKQSDYEEAACLRIDPKPDVVIRVFMIFGGVKRGTQSHTEWSRATVQTIPSWRDIVGVSQETADLMEDSSRYRVLEWGGMRVVPAALPVHQ